MTIIFVRHFPKKYKNRKGGFPLLDPPIVESHASLSSERERSSYSEISDLLKKVIEEIEILRWLNVIHTFKCDIKIISSPFLRTRQTANLIKENISHVSQDLKDSSEASSVRSFDRRVKVDIDLRISEFLGNQSMNEGESLKDLFDDQTIAFYASQDSSRGVLRSEIAKEGWEDPGSQFAFQESFKDLNERTKKFIDSIKSMKEEIIIVVSHGIVIDYLVKHARLARLSVLTIP